MRRAIWIEQLAGDARLGFRMLAKQPGSTALAILILALGIGGNTAVFSVADKVILIPIPGRDMDKLLALREVDITHNAPWGVSPPMFAGWSTHTNLFASLAPRRVFMWLLCSLGALGLFLSALGVYAVIAYTVVRRTREIGIRLALGATRGHVARLVLGRSGRLVFNGIVLGGVIAYTLARYLESLMYGVKPGDPWVYGSVLVTLGAVAALACYSPSRRAMRIDPMTAVRYE